MCLFAAVDRVSEHLAMSSCLTSSSSATQANNGLNNKLDELWNCMTSSSCTITGTTSDNGLNGELTRLRNRTTSSSSLAGRDVYTVASCFADRDELSDVETIYSVQVLNDSYLLSVCIR